MKCPTCHEDYATRAGYEAHVPNCAYKDNPLPELEQKDKDNGGKDLKDLKVDELKKIAEDLGVEEFANMKKAELIEAIELKQAEIKRAEIVAKAVELGVKAAETLSDEELLVAIEATVTNG